MFDYPFAVLSTAVSIYYTVFMTIPSHRSTQDILAIMRSVQSSYGFVRDLDLYLLYLVRLALIGMRGYYVKKISEGFLTL